MPYLWPLVLFFVSCMFVNNLTVNQHNYNIYQCDSWFTHFILCINCATPCILISYEAREILVLRKVATRAGHRIVS